MGAMTTTDPSTSSRPEYAKGLVKNCIRRVGSFFFSREKCGTYLRINFVMWNRLDMQVEGFLPPIAQLTLTGFSGLLFLSDLGGAGIFSQAAAHSLFR